jgi:hypothetical protein
VQFNLCNLLMSDTPTYPVVSSGVATPREEICAERRASTNESPLITSLNIAFTGADLEGAA